MKGSPFLSRLQNAPFWLRVGFTYSFMLLVSLLVDVVPWLDSAGRQFFTGLGLPPPEAAFLAYFAIQSL